MSSEGCIMIYVASRRKHKDAIDGRIFAALVLAYLFVPILPYL